MAVQSKFLYVGLLCIGGFAGIELTTGTYLAPSREPPDFNLIGRQGRAFGAANLRGRWSALLNPHRRLAAILTGPFNVDALQALQHIVADRGFWAWRA